MPHTANMDIHISQSRSNLALFDKLAAYQLVGGVKAHQGYDG